MEGKKLQNQLMVMNDINTKIEMDIIQFILYLILDKINFSIIISATMGIIVKTHSWKHCISRL